MSNGEGTWTKADVAKFLQLDVRTVERLRIPRVPLEIQEGKRPVIRFDPDEVRAWWETQKEKARGNVRSNRKLRAVR